MKIGFDDAPAAPAGTYSQHLAKLLAEYAPEHEYIIDGKRCKEFDLYHGFRSGLPFPVILRRIPCVMTVHNLNFLRYPHLYSLTQRLVLLRLYRRMLRSAERLITVNRDAREELSDRLQIDPRKIEVMMPLAARVPHEPPADAELEAVRRKYGLPRDFVLMLGTVEPRHNHEALFEALFELRERERETYEMERRNGTEGLRPAADGEPRRREKRREKSGEEVNADGESYETERQHANRGMQTEQSPREADGGPDLKAEDAGWRNTMPDGVGGRGDLEVGEAAHASIFAGPESPDLNRHAVTESEANGGAAADAKTARDRVSAADSGDELFGRQAAGSGAETADNGAVSGDLNLHTVAESGADGFAAADAKTARDRISAADSEGEFFDRQAAGSGAETADNGAVSADVYRRAAADFGTAERERLYAASDFETAERERLYAPAGETAAPRRVGVVVCGRRTTYADFLLGYARERHLGAYVDFIYELAPDDLPALFRLARCFVYLPDARIEASIVPVVEALRAGLPMVLSDTQLNREAAGDAAVYVHPEAVGEVAAALENVLWDEAFRHEMRQRERRRAELFSEYAVARRLIDIYSSL